LDEIAALMPENSLQLIAEPFFVVIRLQTMVLQVDVWSGTSEGT